MRNITMHNICNAVMPEPAIGMLSPTAGSRGSVPTKNEEKSPMMPEDLHGPSSSVHLMIINS